MNRSTGLRPWRERGTPAGGLRGRLRRSATSTLRMRLILLGVPRCHASALARAWSARRGRPPRRARGSRRPPRRSAPAAPAGTGGRRRRTTCSRALGMQRARIRPLTSGTIGSSSPANTRVGCRRLPSHGRLVHPLIANELAEVAPHRGPLDEPRNRATQQRVRVAARLAAVDSVWSRA